MKFLILGFIFVQPFEVFAGVSHDRSSIGGGVTPTDHGAGRDLVASTSYGVPFISQRLYSPLSLDSSLPNGNTESFSSFSSDSSLTSITSNSESAYKPHGVSHTTLLRIRPDAGTRTQFTLKNLNANQRKVAQNTEHQNPSTDAITMVRYSVPVVKQYYPKFFNDLHLPRGHFEKHLDQHSVLEQYAPLANQVVNDNRNAILRYNAQSTERLSEHSEKQLDQPHNGDAIATVQQSVPSVDEHNANRLVKDNRKNYVKYTVQSTGYLDDRAQNPLEFYRNAEFVRSEPTVQGHRAIANNGGSLNQGLNEQRVVDKLQGKTVHFAKSGPVVHIVTTDNDGSVTSISDSQGYGSTSGDGDASYQDEVGKQANENFRSAGPVLSYQRQESSNPDGSERTEIYHGVVRYVPAPFKDFSESEDVFYATSSKIPSIGQRDAGEAEKTIYEKSSGRAGTSGFRRTLKQNSSQSESLMSSTSSKESYSVSYHS